MKCFAGSSIRRLPILSGSIFVSPSYAAAPAQAGDLDSKPALRAMLEEIRVELDLTDQQVERYARHLVLPEIGEEGQLRLLRSRVLVLVALSSGSSVSGRQVPTRMCTTLLGLRWNMWCRN